MSRPLAKAKKRIEESLLPLPSALLFHVKLLQRHLSVCTNFWREVAELMPVACFT